MFGPTIPILWSMMADVADYFEWTTGRRSTALAFASIIFGLKLGLGVGAWLNGHLLQDLAYSATGQISDAARLGFVRMISLFPAAVLMLGVAVLFGYRLDDQYMKQVEDDLATRRAAASTRPGNENSCANSSRELTHETRHSQSLLRPTVSARCRRTYAVASEPAPVSNRGARGSKRRPGKTKNRVRPIVDDRVNDLIRKMTLAEKIGQLQLANNLPVEPPPGEVRAAPTTRSMSSFAKAKSARSSTKSIRRKSIDFKSWP